MNSFGCWKLNKYYYLLLLLLLLLFTIITIIIIIMFKKMFDFINRSIATKVDSNYLGY